MEEGNGIHCDFLLQGTFYSDVIESVSYKGPSATIKHITTWVRSISRGMLCPVLGKDPLKLTLRLRVDGNSTKNASMDFSDLLSQYQSLPFSSNQVSCLNDSADDLFSRHAPEEQPETSYFESR